MSDATPWKELSVADDGLRLDAWLSKQFHQLSRRAAQAYLAQGNVRVNGKMAVKGYTLQEGDTVSLLVAPASDNWRPLANGDLPLDVVWEDESLIVVNKPFGMPSTANAPTDDHTLANAIAARYPECAKIGVHNGDGGLLHRLDNDTSGLLIAARNVRTHRTLKNLQENNQIEKRYLALVLSDESPLAPQTISVPLDAKSRGGKKMSVTRGGQRAVTHLEEVTQMGQYALVKILLFKGVRHQIRVHLAQKGFPICGDPLYDGPAAPGLERLFLHASGLKFFHPVTSETVEVHCPLPTDLQRVIAGLK
ncbi:MAG: RluA family pseudouridine synthase [Deltaproteobacteria bacterium]|nr:RluA family pseudouridine synthase [Deltaproteobacteria bacterium]